MGGIKFGTAVAIIAAAVMIILWVSRELEVPEAPENKTVIYYVR